MTMENKNRLKIIVIWTIVTALMFIWRYANGTFSERYCLLPAISLGSEILYLCYRILKAKIKNQKIRTVIWGLLLLAAALGFTGKLLHTNPYAGLNSNIARMIAKNRNRKGKQLILSFNKHARRYASGTAIPMTNTYSTLPGSPNGVLPAYLSALSLIYPQIFVIWDMPGSEEYKEKDLDYLNKSNGCWKKLLSSFTTRRRNRIRYLYQYNAGNAMQQKITELQKAAEPNLIKNGDMEKGAGIPPAVAQILGDERKIAFFNRQKTVIPENYDLWWNHAWEENCQGEIYQSAEKPLSGKYSLLLKSEKPVNFLTSQWFPADNYLWSFIYQGKKDSRFKVVVHIRKPPEKWVLDRSPGLEERLVCDGKLQHAKIIITRDLLQPAAEFRVGIQMDNGEIKVDEFKLQRVE